MEKEIKNNKNEADVQTALKSDFSKYVPSVFELPTLDDLLEKNDKKEVIIAGVQFQKTTWGEQALILLANPNNKQYHTGGTVIIKKLHIAIENNIKYPVKAYILRKGEGNLIYFDIV